MPRRASRAKSPPARPAAAAPAGRRAPDWLVVTLVLLAVCVVLYPEPLLQRRVFQSSDAQNADVFGLIGDAALPREGYPEWNPYIFAGMPTFGSLAYTRFVYLPSVPLNFLQDHLGFPPTTWLFVHLLFGGLGVAYLLARWRVPVAGRVLGAVIWILSPGVVSWCVYGHGSKLGTAMYMPWIVAGALDVLGGGGRRAVALTALLLGLQITRGHIQIIYYTLLAVGLLAVVRTVWPFAGDGPAAPPWHARWRRLGALAGALAIAFALGAVLLLPVHGYAGLSIRGLASEGGGAGYTYATNWSFAPSELPTTVFPAASGFGKGTYVGSMPFTDYPNYFGWLSLALGVAALWAGRRRLVVALWALSLLSLLVSFGRHGSPLYDLFYRALPYFNKFRVPVMILILPTLALAALAPLGAALLASEPDGGAGEGRLRRWLPLLLLGGGGLVFLLGATGLAEGGYAGRLTGLAQAAGRGTPAGEQISVAWGLERSDLIRIGLLLAAAGGALVAARRSAEFRRRGLLWALAALVAIDLLGVDLRIVHPERSLVEVAQEPGGGASLVPAGRLIAPYQPVRQTAGQDPAYAAAAGRAGHDRVWPLGNLAMTNDFMAARVHSLGGYHPAKLAAYEQVRLRLEGQAPAGRIADWLAARVVALPFALRDEHLALLRQLGVELASPPFHTGALTLYENRAALPRARLLSQFTLASQLPDGGRDLGAFLDRIQAGQQPFETTVVLDRAPVPAPVAAAAPLPAPEFVDDGVDQVTLRTRAPVPAMLLLADMDAPGWSVTIDGRPAAALRGDLILRAVAVPAGDHEVRWRYRDPWLRRGVALSGLGTLGLVLLVTPWPRRRAAAESGAATDGERGAAAGGSAGGREEDAS